MTDPAGGIRLRTATPADLGALQRVYRDAALGNTGERDQLLADPDTFLTFRGEHLAAGRTVLADEVTGPAGFGTALPPDVTGVPGEAELEDLFTAPARQRRGVARLLVGELADRVRAQGAVRLAVTGNRHALAFYRAVGFVEIGEAATLLGPAPRLHLTL